MKKFNVIIILTALMLSFSNSSFAQDDKKMMDKKEMMKDHVTVIELTQTPGEFNTPELNLKPGKYQFRIVNQSVDKEVGFVIQADADKAKDFKTTAVSNSFTTALVKKGDAQYTGIIDLSEGEYVYSCPIFSKTCIEVLLSLETIPIISLTFKPEFDY